MNKNLFSFDTSTDGTNQGIQNWQDHFCRLTGVYALCFDAERKPITKISASEEEAELIRDLILTPARVVQIISRVTESGIEDQAVEDTDYPNVRIAATAIKNMEGKAHAVWVFCAVIINRDTKSVSYPEPLLDGLSRFTTEQRLFDAIDLFGESMRSLYRAQSVCDDAIAVSELSRRMEQRMEIQYKRAEAMTDVVSLLESKDGFDAAAKKALQLVGEYLKLSNAFIAKVNGDRVNILTQWEAEGEPPLFIRTRNLERPWFLQGAKKTVISSNTPLTPNEREPFDDLKMTALAVIPIQIKQRDAMFFCWVETRQERVFDLEDDTFLSDTGSILKTIVEKDRARSSLERTKDTMLHMLNHIGSSIYVRNSDTDEVVFANQSCEMHFKTEIEDGTLKDIFESIPKSSNISSQSNRPVQFQTNRQVQYKERDKWYDVHSSTMQWIDGSESSLFAIYDITEKKTYQERIEQQAYTDFLTGLYNRLCFERDLAEVIDKTVKLKSKGILMYIDLDDFKHINDGLGHQYGDILLKYISQAMNSIEGLAGKCYRMGGDEFVAIITNEQYDKKDEILDNIKKIFSKPWYLKDADYYCTMSMGTVEFPTEGAVATELVQKADIAMYAAKKSGKNRVVHYSSDIDSSSEKRLDMEKNMRNASADNYREFEIYYQPIIENGSEGSSCHGAEALVRWNSSNGFISPGEFIPLAEYLGLIAPIGNHVLQEACKACKQWNEDQVPDFTINVNLSVVQLLKSDIVDVIQKALDESGLEPSHLTLEVTESLAINDLDRTKMILMNIKKLGVNLALDDFGTGYSSLNNIRALPYDIIKVDQNFVKDLAEDAYSQSFIRMIAELAEAIEADVCVEGIETRQQYLVLEDMKVKYIQGFYFSKPIPRDQFEKKYIYRDERSSRRNLLNVDL